MAPVTQLEPSRTISSPSWVPSHAEDELSLNDLCQIVLRRKWMVLLIIAVFAVLGFAYTLVAHKKYTAVAMVEVAGQSSPEIGLQDLAQGNQSDASTPEMLTTELNTQVAQLSSDPTLIAVSDKLGLEKVAPYAVPAETAPSIPIYKERGLPISKTVFERDRVLSMMSGKLKVSVVKGTRMIQVSYTDRDPALAASIANAIIDTQIEQSFANRVDAYQQISTWMSRQLATLKGDLELNEQRAQQFQTQNRLVGAALPPAEAKGQAPAGPEAAQNIPLGRLLELNQQLTAAEVNRISKEAIYRMTLTDSPEALLSIPNSGLVSDPAHPNIFTPGGNGLAVLQALRQQQAAVDTQLTDAANKYGPKSQLMIDLKNRQASLNTQIQLEMQRISDQAKSDLELAKSNEAGLRAQIGDQEGRVASWSSKEDQLQLLVGEATASRDLYQDMYSKFHEAKFASGMRSPRLTTVDRAKTPSKPSAPKTTMALAGFPFVGAMLSIILCFILDYFDNSLHSLRHIKSSLQVRVLGKSLPRAGKSWSARKSSKASLLNGHLSGAGAEDRAIPEAYRSVRTAILQECPELDGRALALTSASAPEQLQNCGMTLARAFALLGGDVLVIDTHLHGKDSSGIGLSECLQGKARLVEAVVPVEGSNNLYLLPAGSSAWNGAELLQSNAFNLLLSDARARYRLVLLLAPDAVRFSDAAVAVQQADVYALLIELGKTQQRDVEELMSSLQSVPAPFLGCIVNS